MLAWVVVRRVLGAVWHTAAWTFVSWELLVVCLVVAAVADLYHHPAAALLLAATPPSIALSRATWCAIGPVSYDRFLGGPLRRHGWRHRVRRDWRRIAERCGLAATLRGQEKLDTPRLRRVRATGGTMTLLVRARAGQTVDDLFQAADAVATTIGAQAVETRPVGPGLVEYLLTMQEALHELRRGAIPAVVETDGVTLGRRSDGAPWRLDLAGRHTLVVGRSGSGKGSVFWSIAGNLAPASHAGLVKLWGVDLKGGVEVAVGQGMFAEVAMDEKAAVRLLGRLLGVVTERQAVMRGQSRLFEPSPGDPAHVLLIDELAVLTTYASREVVNEASNLLKLLLTQGRAFGVMVVAFVQDPRKETVGMRDLFTQVMALRLASAVETRVVLGDGMADLAPAHRIPPTMPGTGYLVGDDGTVTRVRADWWPDDLIRYVAHEFPAARVQFVEGDEAA